MFYWLELDMILHNHDQYKANGLTSTLLLQHQHLFIHPFLFPFPILFSWKPAKNLGIDK
jgi:hypothetical protein